MTTEEQMQGAINDVAVMLDIKPTRVEIQYNYFGRDEGGSPWGWTIKVTLPAKDKRRNETSDSVTCDTLAEAQARIVERNR